MSNPLLPTFSGPLGNALTSSTAFVDLLETRDPTSFDSGYPVQKKWLNTITNNLWYLKNFSSTTGQVLANWILISSSIVAIEKLQGNTGGAVSPDGSNIIHTIGDGIGITVAGNPGTNTLTWSLAGGGIATEKFQVDAFTAPGTNPVVPTALGLVTITGGQIPAGTTGNVIQTNSLAANTYTIQVQRSQAVAVSTMADNGVSHFNSAQFTVNSSAFVSLVNPAPSKAINTVNRVVVTFAMSPFTYTPTTGMVFADVEVVGAGGGSGGCAATGVGTFAVSGGGGAGGYSRKLLTAAAVGASQTVTIGAAGTAAAAGNNNGGTGGTTTFGAIFSATGGIGGTGRPASGGMDTGPGGAGGSGSGGDFNTTGEPGASGLLVTAAGSGFFSNGGRGGNCFFGGGGPETGINSGPANPATSYGGGAAGGGSNQNAAAIAGAAGFAGVCVITEYISS